MNATLYAAKTGLSAQDLKLTYIANNIANAESTAYKAQRPEFAALMSKKVREPSATEGAAAGGLQIGSGVQAVGTVTDFSQGIVQETKRKYDLMIQGDGFFKVIKEDGSELYTRNGAFMVNEDGDLATHDNYLLEPSINIPDNATSVEIDRKGKVLVRYSDNPEGEELGEIELYKFINPNGLLQLDGGMYAATESSGDEIAGIGDEDGFGYLMQGYLEGSNVNTINEMVAMITAQRAYDSSSKALQAANQTQQQLTQVI
ncbi:flagellar basal-body rod protein FlgG [Vibrio sp. D431a]|uniref:flagellar basal-body rod protein FlgG n=1 Tax=Vibrio sp. D431a TaxID=2837388 RepID=UPI0025523F52|nr:flagellar basal-body rod protein FlgG [Vibrio sp. D431a]MDK9793910.1 flagellar basal-body rod protein FlgG [Vibrio sp. D431a]